MHTLLCKRTVMRLNTEQLVETFHSYVTPRHDWLVGGDRAGGGSTDGRPIGYFRADGIRWVLIALPKTRPGRPTSRARTSSHSIVRTWRTSPWSRVARSSRAARRIEPCLPWSTRCGPTEMPSSSSPRTKTTSDRDGTHTDCADCHHPVLAADTAYEAVPAPAGRPGRLHDEANAVSKNYDFATSRTAREKARLSSGLALLTALFANSPLLENKPTGFKSIGATSGPEPIRSDRLPAGAEE